ncbi:MAG: single-stranded-DNA-specific exonuclease RecJ [Bacillota bacterium]|jgi:single-stranded-DNA-specific exonuclease
MNKWMLRQASTDPKKIMEQHPQIPKIIAQILAIRGYTEIKDIEDFLYPEKLDLESPLLFKDMEKALSIIASAIKSRKKIAIFGDYDADGIMSTVILYRTLISLGGNITFYIPQRETEGYGLNNDAIGKLYSQGVKIILTCDTGISAIEQVEFAISLGMEVVILDHHDVLLEEDGTREIIPPAAAVVDPKQAACKYPFKQYCAAGICYRFSQAIYDYWSLDWHDLAEDLLPFATIATICDLVELKGDNRHIVKKGLPMIKSSHNFGLKALLKLTGLEGKNIDIYHVGFILGPCINASGRLEMASMAVEMFLTEDENMAHELATHLVELNCSRKEMTTKGTAMAIELVKKQALQENKVIVLHCPEIPESVAGIIAGKVKEHFYRPTIILTGNDDIFRGSCRSIEGYNISQALSSCRDLLITFGGHPMAAGFSIYQKNLDSLHKKLNDECKLALDEMVPVIRIDKKMSLHLTSRQLAQVLHVLHPHGKGNDIPYFADKNVSINRINVIGKDGNVVKFICNASGRNNIIELISFNGRKKLENLIISHFGEDKWLGLLNGHTSGIRMDFIYTIATNEYNGKDNLQLQVIDFRIGEENK